MGLKELWQKTIFPDIIKRKREEREYRESIRKEALEELKPELKQMMKDKIKEQEKEKLKKKAEGSKILEKLGKGFSELADKVDSDKVMQGFSLNANNQKTNKYVDMMGTGKNNYDEKLKKMLK